jgi:hypothetical protein
MDADAAGTAPSPPGLPPPARRWDTDRIVGVTAIAIGVFSLFVTVYQTYLTRQAQSASVLPYLAFGVTSNDQGAHMTLRNDGVGPARIEAFRIHYNGTTRDLDPYEFYLAMRPGTRANLAVDKVTAGRLLPANATIQMCGVAAGADRDAVLGEMLKLFALADAPRAWLVSLGAAGTAKAVMEVEYSSIYGDRWRLRSDQLVPQAF